MRAIVGGRGKKNASLTLNRATDSLRQPGSTFKILAAYAPALDACDKTLASCYENEPFTYTDGTPVGNWDDTDYGGNVTIREAIVRSVNVAAVRCITEISPQVGFSYARRFGITTLHDADGSDGASDVIQPLALGGITEGISNLELCAAYAAIANGGIYRTPRFFTRIEERNGNILFGFSEAENQVRDFSASEFFQETPIQRDNTRILKTAPRFCSPMCCATSFPTHPELLTARSLPPVSPSPERPAPPPTTATSGLRAAPRIIRAPSGADMTITVRSLPPHTVIRKRSGVPS